MLLTNVLGTVTETHPVVSEGPETLKLSSSDSELNIKFLNAQHSRHLVHHIPMS